MRFATDQPCISLSNDNSLPSQFLHQASGRWSESLVALTGQGCYSSNMTRTSLSLTHRGDREPGKANVRALLLAEFYKASILLACLHASSVLWMFLVCL